MTTKRQTVLLGTAMTLILSGGAMAATGINLNRDVIPNLNEECQTLAQEIRERNNSVPDANSDAIIDALNENDAEACMQAQETLASAEQPRDEDMQRASDSETARDEETAEVTESVQLEEEATIEGQAAVIVPKPDVDVDVAAPRVTVQKAQPEVSVQRQPSTIQVEQPQPKVNVQIPEIVVQVEVPAPSIYIQTDDPTVDIASADPQVQVEQGEPKVTVRQPDPRLDVDLGVQAEGDDADADADTMQTADNGASDGESGDMNRGGDVSIASNDPQVEILQPEGEPRIEIGAADPQVEFRGSEPNVSVSFTQEPTVEIAQTGDPKVTFETAEEREARMQSQQTEQKAENGTAPDAAKDGQDVGNTMLAGDLLDMEVVGADGDDLGEPEAIIERDGRMLLIVEEGGFLGLGENAVAVPMDRVAFDSEEEVLRLSQLTEDEIEDADAFEWDSSDEIEMDREVRFD